MILVASPDIQEGSMIYGQAAADLYSFIPYRRSVGFFADFLRLRSFATTLVA
jgi:hypothetical protein